MRSPNDLPTTDEVVALESIQQLTRWHQQGRAPALHAVPNDQWVLIFDTNGWVQGEPDPRSGKPMLRFSTGHHPTIVAAVQAAQEVIK